MAYFGYVESNKGATSGSRVRFYNPENKASMMLHKPHPGDQMVKRSCRERSGVFKGAWTHMNSILRYKGYSARPEYSADDQVFYGKILGIDDLVDFYTENAKRSRKNFVQRWMTILNFAKR